MELKEIAKARHATKSFDGRQIPADKLEELQEIIRLSATSFNLQPWRAVVIGDAERKEALKDAVMGLNQERILKCSHLFVFCANLDLDALADSMESTMTSLGVPAKNVAEYVGMIRGTIKGMDRQTRLSWAQRQTYLALGNGLNGAKSLGFDSCPMEGFSSDAVAKVLQLPDTLVPAVLMPVGYGNDTPHPKWRFTKEEMFL